MNALMGFHAGNEGFPAGGDRGRQSGRRFRPGIDDCEIGLGGGQYAGTVRLRTIIAPPCQLEGGVGDGLHTGGRAALAYGLVKRSTRITADRIGFYLLGWFPAG
ncbi:hypothetical protein D3C80_1436250 [compost metagenome]